MKSYSFDFVLVANTWKHVTVTVPGNSGITINNDNGNGLDLFIAPYYGANFTTSSHTDNVWQTYSGSDLAGDSAQNWKNTSNATFFITGVQLEVGTNASDFEYESYGETLQKCQRYYYQTVYKGSADTTYAIGVAANSSTAAQCMAPFPVTMRAAPTFVVGGDVAVYDGDSVNTITNISANGSSTTSGTFNVDGSGLTTGRGVAIIANASSEYLSFSAEL